MLCAQLGERSPPDPGSQAAAAAATELLQAAADGDLGRLGRALDTPGCNLYATDSHGWTAMHLAAGSGHEECVDRLLRRGASHGGKSVDGLTPLHVAAGGGRDMCLAVLSQLLGGALLSECHPDGEALAAQEACVRTLLYAGVDVEAAAIHGIRALHMAAAVGDEIIVRALLAAGADPGAHLTVPPTSFTTPASVADEYGHPEVAQLLLSATVARAGGRRGVARGLVATIAPFLPGLLLRWCPSVSHCCGRHSLQRKRLQMAQRRQTCRRGTGEAERGFVFSSLLLAWFLMWCLLLCSFSNKIGLHVYYFQGPLQSPPEFICCTIFLLGSSTLRCPSVSILHCYCTSIPQKVTHQKGRRHEIYVHELCQATPELMPGGSCCAAAASLAPANSCRQSPHQ